MDGACLAPSGHGDASQSAGLAAAGADLLRVSETAEHPRQLGYFINTYVISLGTAVLTIALSALCAYGFSRFHIRGARFILLAVLALQLLPNVSIILPFFNLAQALQLHNTYFT